MRNVHKGNTLCIQHHNGVIMAHGFIRMGAALAVHAYHLVRATGMGASPLKFPEMLDGEAPRYSLPNAASLARLPVALVSGACTCIRRSCLWAAIKQVATCKAAHL